KVHPGKGKYVDYRRISRYRIGPKFKPRTYYVHEESRDVHSVGKVRLFFSTTKDTKFINCRMWPFWRAVWLVIWAVRKRIFQLLVGSRDDYQVSLAGGGGNA